MLVRADPMEIKGKQAAKHLAAATTQVARSA
jgi:hypothetical protein